MIFPEIQAASGAASKPLPLAKEVMFDFARGVPVFRGGVPVYVTGREAVRVWAWKALNTWRYLHPIYSRSYGCDVYDLIGRAYSEDLKHSEAVRYVRDCLCITPSNNVVRDVAVDFRGDLLTISCCVSSIYGEVTLNV